MYVDSKEFKPSWSDYKPTTNMKDGEKPADSDVMTSDYIFGGDESIPTSKN